MPAENSSGSGAPTDLDRELDHYLRYVTLERGLATHTISAYKRDLLAYLSWLSDAKVLSAGLITSGHVSEYCAALSGAARSRARKISSIKNFHRFLVDEKITATDPSLEVELPALPLRLPKALTQGQVQALLDAVVGVEPQALRDRALLEFLYATGSRISEALALTVDDVLDDSRKTAEMIRVTGKGNKQRIIPVGSYARAALDAYLTRARPVLVSRAPRSTPALFVGVRGGALSRQNAWLLLQATAKKADLEGLVSPHTLRHSFATHILNGGADIRVVQELLGHASVSTTQIYTKVTIDSLRDVYQSAHPRAR
jgi:integrase/recombinase XerD